MPGPDPKSTLAPLHLKFSRKSTDRATIDGITFVLPDTTVLSPFAERAYQC